LFCSVSRSSRRNVDDASHDHGEHEQDAAEQLQTFVEGHGTGIAQISRCAMSISYCSGVTRMPGSMIRLAARDGDGDRSQPFTASARALAGFASLYNIGVRPLRKMRKSASVNSG